MPIAFDRRRMVFWSLLSGLCPLLPVPFLDDWLRDRVRRRMVREMARHHRVALDPPGVRWLADGPPWSVSGCAKGCVSGALFKPIFYIVKKLLRSTFRKLIYVLAIKDASDTFSITVHRAWMIDRALASGHLGRADDPPVVWQAMKQVEGEIDPRPFEASVRAVFRGSRATVKRGVRMLRRALRRGNELEDRLDDETLDAEASLLDEMVTDLDAELESSRGYFEQLATRYVEVWKALKRDRSMAHDHD